jgi:hypothetical protein
MILHDQRNEEAIRNFFSDVYELYVKVRTAFFVILHNISSFLMGVSVFQHSQILLNPFYSVNTPILSSSFDQKVKALGKKYFNTRYP